MRKRKYGCAGFVLILSALLLAGAYLLWYFSDGYKPGVTEINRAAMPPPPIAWVMRFIAPSLERRVHMKPSNTILPTRFTLTAGY